MKTVILVKYGEIALRGKNRAVFENHLIRTLERNIDDSDYTVRKEQGRFVIERADADVDFAAVFPKIETVLGIVGFCLCVKTTDQDIATLRKIAILHMRRLTGKPFTFKVKVLRAVKSYPMNSGEIAADIGEVILNAMPNARVDVHNPEVTLRIELRNAAYIYSEDAPGYGGLPAGTSGRGMLLLSGGIDSPVAGFLSAKRGIIVDGVYFNAPPFTSPRAEEKVHDLARRLSAFMGSMGLYVVNFTPVQLYLRDHVPEDKLTVFLKRQMLKVAEMLAEKDKCLCLITGDAVGQVASQTLAAIHATNSAASLPVLRPLCGMDKREIMTLAEKIGTYDISIRPYDDCCTLFVAKHPEIRPKLSVIERLEKKLDGLNALNAQAAAEADYLTF